MALHVVNEARRCLNCKVPQCRKGCPINTPIPDMIQLFLQNQLEAAGEMLFLNNPLSIVCSLVCDHEKQCEGHCVLGRKGMPVHISSIENYISDAYLDRLSPVLPASSGKRAAIIGSGPAGMAAAIYAQRAGLKAAVLEKTGISGGQVLTTYEVDNYPGLPEISGFDLSEKFKEHALRLGAEIRTAEVKNIIDQGATKVLNTDQGCMEARTVLIATGAHHAKLHIPGEEELAGMGVSYCATCDGAFFRNRTAVVVGGGDVAVEDAIFLARFCKKVYLVHRRDELRAEKILQESLFACKNVELIWDSIPLSIEGTDKVEALKIQNKKTQEESFIETDGVFIAVGIVPGTEKFKDLVKLDEAGYIVAGEDGITSEPGIFAAGDIRTKNLRQVVTAVADGANAVASAQRYLLDK